MTRSTHIGFLAAVGLLFLAIVAIPLPDLPIVIKSFELQETRTDCGPAALSYILENFNIAASVSELRRMTGESGSGTSMLDLKRAGERFGLTVRGWKVVPADLRRISRPAIVLLHGSHFAVLKEVQSDEVLVIDPAHGEIRMSLRLFLRSWSGYTLTFKQQGQDTAREEQTI